MQKYTTRDFEKDFPNDDACLDWLVKSRFPTGIHCEKCGKTTSHYRIKGRLCYGCEFCGSHVYPMAGTIFQDSHTPLKLWFKAIAYMAVTRCGISSRQLSRDLGVGVKTGYRIWHQVRQILVEGDMALSGTVEVDETYIGGHHVGGKRGRGDPRKTAVFGMAQRGGTVIAQPVPNVATRTVIPLIEHHVDKSSTVCTDEFFSYNALDKKGFNHKRVNHAEAEYVAGDVHTNTIEGFWSQLKRSIDGTYHHVTPKHLREYVNEYSFRYNHRKDEQPMFLTMLGQVACHASEKACTQR